MREYRGKRIDNGEWVEGSLVHECAGQMDISISYLSGEYGELVCRDDYEVDPETVGQYIGREDREGSKLFDGDIAKGPRGSIGIISWHPSWCGYYFKTVLGINDDGKLVRTMSSIPLWNDADKYLIIGNRWDHPHLLEGQGND